MSVTVHWWIVYQVHKYLQSDSMRLIVYVESRAVGTSIHDCILVE